MHIKNYELRDMEIQGMPCKNWAGVGIQGMPCKNRPNDRSQITKRVKPAFHYPLMRKLEACDTFSIFHSPFSILHFLLLALVLASCIKPLQQSSDRYVVLSPEIAEMLACLGVSDRIVGITAECDYPPELQNIQSVGNFGQFSLERIIALNPSVVFTTALEQNEITAQLNRLNISTYQFYPQSIEEMIAMIDSLGVIVGKEATADSLSRYLSDRFEGFRQLSQSRTNKSKVYIEIYGNPIMSADNSSYLGQLLEYAGVENIFPSLIRDYARVNAEDVVILNPDVIILTYPGVSVDDVKNRKGWGDINAVLNGKIYTIDDVNPDLILRAGARNIEGIEKLMRIVYE